MHNLPKKHALVNDLSTDSLSQFAAEGELDSPKMQGQGSYSGSGVNYVQSPKQLVTNAHHALPQHEMYSGQLYPHSNADNSNENNTSAATLQTVASPVVPSSKQQHSLLQPRAQSQLHAEPDFNIVDQTHANLKKNLDRNCQVSANPPKKQQDVKAQSDLISVNHYSSQMGTSTLVPGCVEAANVNSVVSADVTQWKVPETVSDFHIFNQAEFGSTVSPSLTSSGCEPDTRPFLSQGLVERQSSVSLPPVQWLQKQSEMQPSIILPPSMQQKEKSQKQHSQKEPELVREEGINSLHINPAEL